MVSRELIRLILLQQLQMEIHIAFLFINSLRSVLNYI